MVALIGIHQFAQRAIKNGMEIWNSVGTETQNGTGTDTRNGMRTQGIAVVVQNNRFTWTERELFIDRYCISHDYQLWV